MSDFYVEKQIIVGSCDGWRHVITIHDEPPVIKIEYQEWRQETNTDKSRWVTVDIIDGLWSENAILLGKALVELGEFIESQKPEKEVEFVPVSSIVEKPF